ncbi:MAG: hypothetical protein ACYTGX_03085 [Planctomycetota bacterium]
MTDPATSAPRPAPPAGLAGLWPVIALIVLGLLPFVVSLAVVVYTRREAAKDPKAQQWIDEHAGRTKLLGNRAK